MDVSIIIPTFNEVENVVPLVQEIKANMPLSSTYEIIVVDDDSPDGTIRAVEQAFPNDPSVVPLLRTHDRGLANSVRAGIDKSSGDKILVMGADFTHDPREISPMLRVGEVYDIVIGSRFCAGGNMYSTTHYMLSLYYNRFARVFLRTQVQDNLGGYFTMPRAELYRLPFEKIFYGYGDYFFRLLHYAQRMNMSIVEVPAQYQARRGGTSKSNFPKMLLSYSWAIGRLSSAMVSLKLESLVARRKRKKAKQEEALERPY